jgi:hypothetical protein
MNILGEERIVCCTRKFVLTIFTITTLFYILVDLLKLLKIIRYEHKFDISKFVIFQYDSGYLVIFCHCGNYCEITFIGGVPIFVGRLKHEIKNPTNNETCISLNFTGKILT